MRKLVCLTLALFILVGCAGDSQKDGQNLTIFGRLSELVQFGSTEETIAYKLQTDDLFITIRGEVLVNRPGELSLFVTDRATGVPVDNVDLSIYLCQTVDEDVWGPDTCAGNKRELYELTLTPTFADGVYYVDGFKWDRAGGWLGTLSVASANNTETETRTFSAEVYPARPPSTNAFELVNISLPFVVIGLFLATLRLRNGQLMQSVRHAAAS